MSLKTVECLAQKLQVFKIEGEPDSYQNDRAGRDRWHLAVESARVNVNVEIQDFIDPLQFCNHRPWMLGDVPIENRILREPLLS